MEPLLNTFIPVKSSATNLLRGCLLSNPLIEDDLLFLEFPARFRGSGAVLGLPKYLFSRFLLSSSSDGFALKYNYQRQGVAHLLP